MRSESEKRANQYRRNHGDQPTASAVNMALVEATAAVAMALERQTEVLEEQLEIKRREEARHEAMNEMIGEQMEQFDDLDLTDPFGDNDDRDFRFDPNDG